MNTNFCASHNKTILLAVSPMPIKSHQNRHLQEFSVAISTITVIILTIIEVDRVEVEVEAHLVVYLVYQMITGLVVLQMLEIKFLKALLKDLEIPCKQPQILSLHHSSCSFHHSQGEIDFKNFTKILIIGVSLNLSNKIKKL